MTIIAEPSLFFAPYDFIFVTPDVTTAYDLCTISSGEILFFALIILYLRI